MSNYFYYVNLKGELIWLLNIHLPMKFIVEAKAGALVVVPILGFILIIGLVVLRKLPARKMDVKINISFYK